MPMRSSSVTQLHHWRPEPKRPPSPTRNSGSSLGSTPPRGGVLPRLLPLFRVGLGGRFGSGRQWWSWVTLDDLIGIYRHALTASTADGPLHATAPNPATNAEFTATLAKVLGRPALVPVPSFGPRLLVGQMADQLLFDSARVHPAATEASGYSFQHPNLEAALRHVLTRP